MIWKLITQDSPNKLVVLRRAEKKKRFIAQAYALTQSHTRWVLVFATKSLTKGYVIIKGTRE